MDENKDLDHEIETLAMQGSHLGGLGGVMHTGGDMLKGGSPIPLLLQKQAEAILWLKTNLSDTDGALLAILIQHIKDDEVLFGDSNKTPLGALKYLLERYNKDSALYELVRQVDFKYGQSMGERPIFQSPGAPARADDPYTHQSVRSSLDLLLENLIDAPS